MGSREPRQNDKMLGSVEKSYEKHLYVGDEGMWTIVEVTKRPIAKVPSEGRADEVTKIMTEYDKLTREDQLRRHKIALNNLRQESGE